MYDFIGFFCHFPSVRTELVYILCVQLFTPHQMTHLLGCFSVGFLVGPFIFSVIFIYFIYFPLSILFQVFEGNSDQDTIIYNRLNNPVITQFVRLNPKTWNEAIAIRTEFYGCDAGMAPFNYVFNKHLRLFLKILDFCAYFLQTK